MGVCGQSLFGSGSNYIKVADGSFVAVEGSTIAEKLIMSDLRMPYKQLLKAKIMLKPGQTDYLLNHLGLGDNATFLAIKVTYDPKSVIEEDNYINWKYYDDITKVNSMAQMLVLTGNSTNRIPQLFLTNPNEKYGVSLEVMIAVIDDNSSYFEYKPIVYFTDSVDLENAAYAGPYNTSLGNNFGASMSLSTYGYSLTVSGIRYLLIDNVKDSNGVDMITSDVNYILYDESQTEITSITMSGTYSMYFDIIDTLGNAVDPVDKIEIVVTP